MAWLQENVSDVFGMSNDYATNAAHSWLIQDLPVEWEQMPAQAPEAPGLGEFQFSAPLLELFTESDSLAGNDAETAAAATSLPRQSSSGSPAMASPDASAGKRVSDSRLSAKGLADVLKLDSPQEALNRERFILDIFERELHFPLGYKTWVRGTTKEYRARILQQLYRRVKTKYPEYDERVLETIIRRATYYMMQSRLRRERRARAKLKGKATESKSAKAS